MTLDELSTELTKCGFPTPPSKPSPETSRSRSIPQKEEVTEPLNEESADDEVTSSSWKDVPTIPFDGAAAIEWLKTFAGKDAEVHFVFVTASDFSAPAQTAASEINAALAAETPKKQVHLSSRTMDFLHPLPWPVSEAECRNRLWSMDHLPAAVSAPSIPPTAVSPDDASPSSDEPPSKKSRREPTLTT